MYNMIRSTTISLSTEGETQFIDITGKVENSVAETQTKEGFAVIYTKHTTTALFINEGERGLLRDYEKLMQLLPKGAGYEHDRIDSNAHAHLRAVLLGSSVTVPIREASLQLGTWQRIFFAELDGPRQRRVIIQIIGE
jgi:secondary thiamine-phosphate synthase enzyme